MATTAAASKRQLTKKARLENSPDWIRGDRGFSSDALRERIWAMNAKPVIPAKKNEASVRCLDFIYVRRNQVKRLWGRLKEWRAVATRHDKTARSFMGVLCLAAAMNWLRN